MFKSLWWRSQGLYVRSQELYAWGAKDYMWGAKAYMCKPTLVFALVQRLGLGPSWTKCEKGIFKSISSIFSFYRVFRKPETFSIKLLISFLVSDSIPVSTNFYFLVSFWYPFLSYLGLPCYVPVPGNLLSLFPYL